MAKTTKKVNNKLFIVSVQDDDGRIIKVLTGNSYDQAWLLGSTEARAARGYWTIHRFPDGRFIDGNFKQVVIR